MEDDHRNHSEDDFKPGEDDADAVQNDLDDEDVRLEAQEEDAAENSEAGKEDHEQHVADLLDPVTALAGLNAPVAE